MNKIEKDLKDFKSKLISGSVSDVANDFLYSINHIDSFHKSILDPLDNIEKKIRKLSDLCHNTRSDVVMIPPYGSLQIIQELKSNIILKNQWAIIYLIFTLSERYADYLISLNSRLISSNDYDDIKEKLDSKNRSLIIDLEYKIGKLKRIMNQRKSKYIHKLISLLYLYKTIRNAFMFHFKNVDEYSFVYTKENINKKEESLKGELEKINSSINDSLKQFDGNDNIFSILDGCKNRIDSIMRFYEKNQSDENFFLINDRIYRDLIDIFSVISYTFIYFLDSEEPDFS